MNIKKSDFYRLLSPHTRGEADIKKWRKYCGIIRDVIIEQIKDGNRVCTPFGIFEMRDAIRATSGVCSGSPQLGHVKEIKYSCTDSLKEMLNDR